MAQSGGKVTITVTSLREVFNILRNRKRNFRESIESMMENLPRCNAYEKAQIYLAIVEQMQCLAECEAIQVEILQSCKSYRNL